jgi:hypothetical protein
MIGRNTENGYHRAANYSSYYLYGRRPLTAPYRFNPRQIFLAVRAHIAETSIGTRRDSLLNLGLYQ